MYIPYTKMTTLPYGLHCTKMLSTGWTIPSTCRYIIVRDWCTWNTCYDSLPLSLWAYPSFTTSYILKQQKEKWTWISKKKQKWKYIILNAWYHLMQPLCTAHSARGCKWQLWMRISDQHLTHQSPALHYTVRVNVPFTIRVSYLCS